MTKSTEKSVRTTQDYMNGCARAQQNLETSLKWMQYVLELEKEARSDSSVSMGKVQFIMGQMTQISKELNSLRADKLKELKDLEIKRSEERRTASRKTMNPKLIKAVRGRSMLATLTANKKPIATS